ncbi:MAG: monovalent cation/H+ antiporter subunit D family protein [Actinomycetota bacterium]|nr:monovalent cation/H+ antiporter subunit D family protein [Actinomycetota bacterium]
MDVTSVTPLFVLLAPVLGAAATVALRDRPPARELCGVAAGLAQLGLIATMIPVVLAGDTVSFTISAFLPEAEIGLRVDALGLVLAGTSSVLWILTTIYTMGYLGTGPDRALARFHVYFGLTIAATMGVAFSVNLLTLYLFYEALTIITYPLVTHSRTPEAAQGGKRYLGYQLGTGVALLLPAIVLTYTQAGTFDFVPGGVFGTDSGESMLILIYLLFLLGIAKAALLPVHAWLPAAMVAPVPVSALLHAVAVVNVGVFAVFRVIFDVFGTDLAVDLNLGTITLAVTCVTILATSLYALRLDNLKGILAYSTISQLSYMILGVALLNEAGRTGGVLHLVGHAFSKITLFFAVGSVYLASHRTTVRELRGIGRRLPWTMGALVVGALSIVGLPPTVGFISKYFLFLGAADAGQWLVLAVLAMSTVLTGTYYLRIMQIALLEAVPAPALTGGVGDDPRLPRERRVTESPALIVGPLVVTAALTLLLGVAPGTLLELVRAAARVP